MRRPFSQVDVFTSTPYSGNPLAVVLDGEGLSDEEMQRFAHWMNLSETTFVLPPTEPGADYLVRIFMPNRELPFAGHPTLGTCHVWLEAGGTPLQPDVITQQCGVGLVPIRRGTDRLAFAAPPLVRSGPVDDADLDRVVGMLNLDRDDIVDAEWTDNGPGFITVLLADVDAVLAVRPGLVDQSIGVVGVYQPGSAAAIEVRSFFPGDGGTVEDPVTGSLNAAIISWLLRTGRVRLPYIASQGTVVGHAGRVHVSSDDDGTFWVEGNTVTCIRGEVDL